MLIKVKPEAERIDEMLKHLSEKGYSYDYEQALIKCGSGQEKQFLAHLLEGGFDYDFELSNDCQASWDAEV